MKLGSFENVRNTIDAHIEAKMAEFGISHWRINVHYMEGTNENEAEISCLPQYERATIKVWWLAYIDREAKDVLEMLEHEFLHVMHSPFNYYGGLVDRMLSKNQINQADGIWSDSCELTVRNLERLVNSIRKHAKDAAIAEYENKAKEELDRLANEQKIEPSGVVNNHPIVT